MSDTPLALRLTSLTAFLDASSDQEATAALEGLLGDDAGRQIRDVVKRGLGRFAATHLDDVVADVRLAMVQRLWALRDGRGEPIDNLRAYISRASEHACYTFLRRRYPERSRFRNRVRYAAAHHPAISLRRDSDGTWRCESQRRARRAPAPGATTRFLEDPQEFLALKRLDLDSPLPALIDEVLAYLDRDIELDRLVDALAAVLGIKDATVAASTTESGSDPMEMIADPAPHAAEVLEHRQSLERVWSEIVALPPRQRSALLLNLRDPDGGAILHLMPSTGIVSQADIATALGVTIETCIELWPQLPLEDRAIAESMGVTRQQVINLRKSARARLTRRLHEVQK